MTRAVDTCRVALKRGEAVSRELNRTYGDDKKMSKQEKEERQVLKNVGIYDNELKCYDFNFITGSCRFLLICSSLFIVYNYHRHPHLTGLYSRITWVSCTRMGNYWIVIQ